MVSADNVNYDVLTLIFTFLGNTDLVSASLVSKSFKNGATPRLYRSISFRLDQMKRWPRVSSPFTIIVAHPELGVHVRYCDIKAVPKLKGQPHPVWFAACAESLARCPNLLSFTCTSDVPPFLPLLLTKERLTELKLHAAFSTEQAGTLMRLRDLRSLTLYQASWNVCHALQVWIPKLASTLTHLTIMNSRECNEIVLESLLPPGSNLHGLHIIGCPKISHQAVLRLVSRTPLLESLSFTTWENPSTSSTPPVVSLSHLFHLSLDTRCSFSPHTVPALYASIFSAVAACPLTSLTFKLSERMVIGDVFVSQILDDHATTLTRLNAVNVSLTEEGMERVCTRCSHLKQLAVVVPVKELDAFSESLNSAPNLHTLIDVGDSHSVHGARVTLTSNEVRELFRCAPELRKIVSGNRCWTVSPCPHTGISVPHFFPVLNNVLMSLPTSFDQCERIPIYATDDDDEFVDGPDIEDYEIRLKLERLRHAGGMAHLVDLGC